MPKLYIWKVSEAPTGRYRSFEHRGWPTALYGKDRDGDIAAQIYCDDEYTTHRARTGDHAPLTVCVADHSVTPFKWRKMTRKFATLDEAKQAFEALIMKNPQLMAPVQVKVLTNSKSMV